MLCKEFNKDKIASLPLWVFEVMTIQGTIEKESERELETVYGHQIGNED